MCIRDRLRTFNRIISSIKKVIWLIYIGQLSTAISLSSQPSNTPTSTIKLNYKLPWLVIITYDNYMPIISNNLIYNKNMIFCVVVAAETNVTYMQYKNNKSGLSWCVKGINHVTHYFEHITVPWYRKLIFIECVCKNIQKFRDTFWSLVYDSTVNYYRPNAYKNLGSENTEVLYMWMA